MVSCSSKETFLSHPGLNVHPFPLTAPKALLNLWQLIQLLELTCCRVTCAEAQVQGELTGWKRGNTGLFFLVPASCYDGVALSSIAVSPGTSFVFEVVLFSILMKIKFKRITDLLFVEYNMVVGPSLVTTFPYA